MSSSSFLNQLKLSKDPQSIVNERDSGGRTFLHYAALNNQLDLIKSIQRIQTTFSNDTTENSNTYSESETNGEFITKGTLRHLKLPCNIQDGQGQTPLHLALQSNHLAIAELLLELPETEVHLDDHFGRIPLHWAVHVDALSLLPMLILPTKRALETGKIGPAISLVDKQTHTGDTPLHWAVSDQHIECASFLIDHGAHVSMKNSHGESPLAIALRLNNPILSALLTEANESTKRQRDLEATVHETSSSTSIHLGSHVNPSSSNLPKKKLTIKLRTS